jgi:hypothetical protein
MLIIIKAQPQIKIYKKLLLNNMPNIRTLNSNIKGNNKNLPYRAMRDQPYNLYQHYWNVIFSKYSRYLWVTIMKINF